MTCAMSVVETKGPEILSRQSVQSKTTNTLGKLDPLERNVALEDQSIRFALHLSRLSKVQGSRGVSGSIQELSTRVAEINSIGIND
jgi:hypothetical protein